MVASVVTCPQCGAALAPPSRFARYVTCTFCACVVTVDPSVVSGARYRDALARWNASDAADHVRLGDGAWRLIRPLGAGPRTDVWLAERTRWPSERGVLKLPRDAAGDAVAGREAAALRAIAATGAPIVGTLLPALVLEGVVTAGAHAGRHVLVARAAPRFTCDLGAAARRWPGGIDPAASIWMLRRMLEVARVLVEAGVTHEAPGPEHWLAEEREHGLRLVGFGNARVGAASAGAGAALLVRTAATTLRALLVGPESRGVAPPSIDALLRSLAAVPLTLGVADLIGLRARAGEVGSALPGGPRFTPILP